jgi:uncharacterized protein
VYGKAIEQASLLGVPHVLDGFNVDDRGDVRPGRKAARELGVRSPLDELGFTKEDIRVAARQIDLPGSSERSVFLTSSSTGKAIGGVR